MAMKMISKKIGGKTEFLATGDHYVSLGHKAPRATSESYGDCVLVDGRYILRAGTIWSESGAAVGLVADDYDLTDGDAQVAVVVHGVVNRAKLPVLPSYKQEKEMAHILFVDGESPEAGSTDYPEYFFVESPTISNATYAVAEGSHKVVVKGGSFSFTVTAGVGYHVSAVTVDGDALEPDDDGVYTISNIESDPVIAATVASDT